MHAIVSDWNVSGFSTAIGMETMFCLLIVQPW